MAKSVKQAKEQRKKIQYTDAKATVKKIEESGSGPTSFKVPKGMSRFKFEKAGTYRLNIIPYVVGKHNPNADEGQVHYERTFEVHKGVGVDDSTHACLKQFGERCPICEHAAKLQREGVDRDAIKEFRPKTRQLYLVMDLDNKEAGIQLFETGYYMSFGELLATKIKAVEEDDDTGYDKFFHLGTDGKVLRVLVEKAAYEGRGYFKPVSIEMRDRREEKGEAVPESILDEVPCLDDLLINPGYKELKKLFDEGMESHADSDDEDDDTETTADTDDDEEEDEAPAPKKNEKAKKKVEVELEADDEDEDDSDSDDDEEEDENEESDDSEEEDEDEEEVEINKKTISGKLVNFTSKAGKKMTGTVVLANDKTGIALIRVEGQAKQEQAKYDTISLAKAKAEDDDSEEEDEDEDTEVETDDSDDEGDDEEEEADAEEDEDDEEESEDDTDKEDDEEWDLDEDEDEKEEKPAAKKGKAKPAAKAATAKKKGK